MKDLGKAPERLAAMFQSREKLRQKLAVTLRAAAGFNQQVDGAVRHLQESDPRVAAAALAGIIALLMAATVVAVKAFS